MIDGELEQDLKELGSAEEFFDYFNLDYEPAVLHVNRLHILQRFHDYMAAQTQWPEAESERETLYAQLLEQAYRDFLHSDALTEKVFKVFHLHQPPKVSISVDQLINGGIRAPQI